MCITLACGCASPPKVAGTHSGKVPQTEVELVERVHFTTAGTEVLAGDRRALDHNAGQLAHHRAAVVVLEGHCDERGNEDFNLELGDRRARSVMGELIARGVDPERLIVLSKGESEPVDPNHGPAAWRRNRRVEFIIR